MSETNASTMARPPRMKHSFKRVAILFAGGPAPAANAVISATKLDLDIRLVSHTSVQVASDLR